MLSKLPHSNSCFYDVVQRKQAYKYYMGDILSEFERETDLTLIDFCEYSNEPDFEQLCEKYCYFINFKDLKIIPKFFKKRIMMNLIA